MASKKASASAPVWAAIDCARSPEVSGPGRNNPVAVAGQVGDLSVFDRNIGGAPSAHLSTDCAKDHGPPPRRHPRGRRCFSRCGHDQPVRSPHFPMKQAHCVLFIVIGTEELEPNHLSHSPVWMRKCANLWPHFMQHNLNACVLQPAKRPLIRPCRPPMIWSVCVMPAM